MPAHTFTQSAAALVQVCTPVENNSKLWRSQTLDVSNPSPQPTASTSSEEKSCQGSWNRLDCFHLTARRQRRPAKEREREIQQVEQQRLQFVFTAHDIFTVQLRLCTVYHLVMKRGAGVAHTLSLRSHKNLSLCALLCMNTPSKCPVSTDRISIAFSPQPIIWLDRIYAVGRKHNTT